MVRKREQEQDADGLASSFGASLAEQRKQAGLSMAELARHAGMQRAYIWRVEQGKTLPTLRSAARLAAALDISLAALVADLDVSEFADPSDPPG